MVYIEPRSRTTATTPRTLSPIGEKEAPKFKPVKNTHDFILSKVQTTRDLNRAVVERGQESLSSVVINRDFRARAPYFMIRRNPQMTKQLVFGKDVIQ